MLTLTSRSTIVFSAKKKDSSTNKKLKKFGKRLAKQRRADFDLMGERVNDIAKNERQRVNELVKDHREFLESWTKKEAKVEMEPEEIVSIDFFEK